MMSARQTQYLVKSCVLWSRRLHQSSFKPCKSGRNLGVLNNQVRFFSSSDDQGTKKGPGTSATQPQKAHAKTVDSQGGWNVFQTIQKEVGVPASSIPTFKYASKEETEFLNKEMRALSEDWPELAHMLDGQDISMEALVIFVEENIGSASFIVLCKLIGPYLQVFKKETKQCRMLLEEGIKRMSGASISEALYFVQALNQLPEDEVESKYFEICQEKLKSKLNQMVTPVQIVYAMSMLNKNKMPELFEQLDKLASSHLSTMSLDNLIDLFHIQAIDKRRNPTLIRNIVLALNTSDFSSLTLEQLANIFYACAILNVYNQELLGKATKQTAKVIALNNSSKKARVKGTWKERNSIMHSCVALRWKDDALLNELVGSLERDGNKINVNQFADNLISLFYLGYKNTANLRAKFLDKGADFVRENNKYLWLKYMHGLAARRLAMKSDIKAVLDPEFYSDLVGEDVPTSLRESSRLMLLNLQGCLEVDCGETSRPLAEAEDWRSQMRVLRKKNSIAHSVETALKHISTEIKGPSIDKYGNRLDFEVKFRVSADTASDYSRVSVGIRVLDFHEMVIGSDKTITASGTTALAARLLKAQPMPVLLLPYYKWKSHDISLQNAISLESMLNETVNPTKRESKEKSPSTVEAHSQTGTEAKLENKEPADVRDESNEALRTREQKL